MWRKCKPKIISPRCPEELLAMSKGVDVSHSFNVEGWTTESSKGPLPHDEEERSRSPVSVVYGFPDPSDNLSRGPAGEGSSSKRSVGRRRRVQFDPVVRFRAIPHVYGEAERLALWWTCEESEEMRLREVYRRMHPTDDQDDEDSALVSSMGKSQSNASSIFEPTEPMISQPPRTKPRDDRRVLFDSTVRFRLVEHVYDDQEKNALWWTDEEHQEMRRREIMRRKNSGNNDADEDAEEDEIEIHSRSSFETNSDL